MNSTGTAKRFWKMKFVLPAVVILGVLLAMVGVASAAVISGGTIIPAPANIENSDVVDGAAANLAQEAFDESQGVLLAAPLAVDAGFIPVGTIVDSHMIFLNKPDGVAGVVTDVGRVWTFDKPVVGVMSDSTGTLEVASSALLGATGTTYPGVPFGARGMEGGTRTWWPETQSRSACLSPSRATGSGSSPRKRQPSATRAIRLQLGTARWQLM